MARYGQAFKERAVARLLPPESSSVEKVSREIGVGMATLERWRSEAVSMPASARTWTAAARLAVDLAVPLLAQLDAAQVEYLAKYSTRQHKKAVKRYHDPDPQRRKAARQERITDRIERWTGKLNDGQRRHIKDALEHSPDLSASWLAYRAQQTDTLLAMLKTGAKAEALRTHLNDWWVHRAGTSTETRQRWHVARHEFVQLMDDLAMTLTDRQLRTLETRLADLRKELASFVSRTPQPVKLQPVPACGSSLA